MGRAKADGRKVFRLTPPTVLWWAWVVFAAVSLGDIVVQGRDRASLEAALVIVVVTGLAYSCALRPRVVADQDSVTVHNPIRDHRVPWGAVKEVAIRDSVELHCSRPAPKSDKTVYSWALYSPRRAQRRSQIRNQMFGRRDRGRPQGYARMPAQAQAALQHGPAELMAKELARLSDEARARGAAGGALAGRWAWDSVAAIVIPVAVLVFFIVLK